MLTIIEDFTCVVKTAKSIRVTHKDVKYLQNYQNLSYLLVLTKKQYWGCFFQPLAIMHKSVQNKKNVNSLNL